MNKTKSKLSSTDPDYIASIVDQFSLTQDRIQTMQMNILDWYAINKRVLPWRDRFETYPVLVSETMLQQTQVSRVIDKFNQWMDELPTLEDLANASQPTLLRLRSGLGFNSRVLRLQQTAIRLVNDYNGSLPDDRETLLTFPGIGAYSSASLMAFVYNKEAPVVDTNIRRVCISLLDIPETVTTKQLEAVTYLITPKGRANDRNNALMDYGATHLTARRTGVKSKSKQSKFEGSKRQVRGGVLKWILTYGPSSHDTLRANLPHAKFDQVVEDLMAEGFIELSDGVVTLKE